MATRVLITGATGLIGRHVVAHWDVTGLTPVTVDRGADDLLCPGVAAALVERMRPDVVLHLAWSASGSVLYRDALENETWADASLELARVSRDVGAWFLGTGTAVDEQPARDAYTAAKGRLWRALESDAQADALTWLRPFYVLDPDRRRPALVDHALTARAAGRPAELRTPASLHDFVHAVDVARGVIDVVRYGLRGVVPLGSGTLRPVSAVMTALGVDWEAAPDPHTEPTQHHQAADTRRLCDRGWSPVHTEEFFRHG